MRLRVVLLAALLLGGAASAPSALEPPAPAQTASGHAHAELRRAKRQGGELTIELRFLTDYSGYSGEPIYDGLSADPSVIRIEAGGVRYDLARDAEGRPKAPESLALKFNYDPSKNPRVGSWKGVFAAPPPSVGEAVLVLPNLGVIGPFPIAD